MNQQSKIKKYLKQKKKEKIIEELPNFDKLSLGSNSDDNISMNSVSSAELNLNDSELENMSPFSGYNSADDE